MSTIVWQTALKLGYITNFDMLVLVMGFTSLVDNNLQPLYLHKALAKQTRKWTQVNASFRLAVQLALTCVDFGRAPIH